MSSKHAWSDQKMGSYELRTEICLGQLEQGKFCWDLPFQARPHSPQASSRARTTSRIFIVLLPGPGRRNDTALQTSFF